MFKNYKFYLLVLPVLLLSFLGFHLASNVVMAEVEDPGEGAVCTGYDVKVDEPGTYDEVEAKLTVTEEKVTWEAKEGWEITEVCVKEGGSGGGVLFYPTVGDGEYLKGDHDISHAAINFREIVEEEHDLTLSSMCSDDPEVSLRWRVFHNDDNDDFYPVTLGYELYPGNIQELAMDFTYDYTKSARFSNPYYFNTPRSEGTTLKLYWWNESDEKWVYAGVKASSLEQCEYTEEHNLTLTSICRDDINEERRWRVFHEDMSDMFYPVTLGYEIYSGPISTLTNPFTFNYTKANRFSDPYYFTTPLTGDSQTVKLYWYDNEAEDWVEDDTKAATNEVCYELCENTTEQIGEWSDWVIDPEDDTQEMRTRTITLVDAEVTDHVCSQTVETEYRELEDEGDVEGITDERDDGEVLGTSIVYAQTDGGANLIIYIVEYILVILSGFGIKFVGKKHLTV